MRIESLIETVSSKIREFRSNPGVPALSEIPEEYRILIYDSEALKLKDTIREVSNMMLDKGMRGLNTRQIAEAIDMWSLLHGEVMGVNGQKMKATL